MTIKGPAIFLAQFAGDKEPFNTLDSITKWAADLGYKGVQIPTWDSRMIDLKKASESKIVAKPVDFAIELSLSEDNKFSIFSFIKKPSFSISL